jgi:uncharacterized protein (DUF952 family)
VLTRIYKVLDRDCWRKACESGVFEGAAIDLRDGFIHLSSHSQVRETVRLHFRGQDNLLLIAFDVDDFGSELKWELSRGGEKFPHLYTNIDPTLAIGTWALELLPDGTHEFPVDN